MGESPGPDAVLRLRRLTMNPSASVDQRDAAHGRAQRPQVHPQGH